MKKTSLSMDCRISYDRGLVYLQWLETLSLINNEIDEDGFELIGLSSRGIELYKKEFELEQIDPLN
ncbi:MAG: hypothetical protein ACREBI_11855 [Nitrosotalea sp.]